MKSPTEPQIQIKISFLCKGDKTCKFGVLVFTDFPFDSEKMFFQYRYYNKDGIVHYALRGNK